MKKRVFGLLVILLVILAGIFIYLNFSKPQVCFERNCFDVEIADNPQERQQGLMNRENLNAGSGMLFIFEESGRHGFWMKDTKIPLDIIWVNSEKEVVHVENNAEPCLESPCETYFPNEDSKYVLEINSWMASANNIEEGQKVKFKNI